MERANYFTYEPRSGVYIPQNLTRPVNVVFLTSVRDVGKDDLNGSFVETGRGEEYMEGAIERVVKETMQGRRLRGLVSVVGVITDDMPDIPKDLAGSEYGASPSEPKRWIFPRDLSLPDGTLLRERVSNIPSEFRRLPTRGAEIERRRGKFEFERAVLERTQELGGDIIISDHYMARLDYLYAELGMWGRVLNIHPAVTLEGHPFNFRGKTPTADAINWARRGLPVRTGATLHFVDSEIDAGSVIAYTDETPVYPDDELQWLRYRNYTSGKLPLLVEGLSHFVRNIYPNIDQLDLRRSREEVLV